MYIMTASRMISGPLWKYLKGSLLLLVGGYVPALQVSTGFLLTGPLPDVDFAGGLVVDQEGALLDVRQ